MLSGKMQRPEVKDVNIGMLSISAAIVIILLAFVFCIRIYINQKANLLNEMRVESEVLKALYAEKMSDMKYLLQLLTRDIENNIGDTKYINTLVEGYNNDEYKKQHFGWKNVEVIHDIDATLDKVSFDQTSPNIYCFLKNDTMFLGANILKNGKFVFAVIVQLDLNQISINNIHLRQNSKYSHVLFINNAQNILIKYKKAVDKFHDIYNISENGTKDIYHINMWSGENFYITQVKDLPILLLVSNDNNAIRYRLYYDLAAKFLEMSFISICFLIIALMIYRREVRLRKNAELSLDIAMRATNAKSDFLAFTAHEIRSPLGFILTGSEMMQREMLGKISESYSEYINGIHANAKLILEFITDILDETHILEGSFKVIDNEVDIAEVIKNAVSINHNKSSKKKISVNTKIAANLPHLICDARRILQVINNLLSNAIQYSRENTSVNVISGVENEELFISIIDEGVGMTDAEIAIAFEKYGTVRKKDFRFVESYGLGLPIVKMLLDAHDAKIIVSSKVNIGSEFKIIFPSTRILYKS